MIRPSALTLAEHCELAPVLASEYPETNENIERGNLVDREVTRELLGGAVAQDPDAIACVEWLRNLRIGLEPGGRLYVQEPITLNDPATGEVITRGTPDIVWIDENTVFVIDLKKQEQYMAGRISDPDRSLQLHAYALAWAIRSGASMYKVAYLLFGDGEASYVWSKTWELREALSFLDRMRRINEKSNANGARGHRPVATAGPHCTQCYQRLHCPSWSLPAHEGPTSSALAPLTQPGGLTRDNAAAALMATMAIKEVAEKAMEILKAFVEDGNGPIVLGDRQWGPIMVQGKRSGASVAELEALNLMHLIKPGRSYQQWRLGKRKP